jgi:hypothetical protein
MTRSGRNVSVGAETFYDTEIIWLGRIDTVGKGDYSVGPERNYFDGNSFEDTEMIHLTWKRNGKDRYDTVVSEKIWFRIASR